MKSKTDIRDTVRAGYSNIAKKGISCCGPSCGCGSSNSAAAQNLAKSVGYSENELATLPDGANMGLSCGNPIALASLKKGETVVDLGSGGGFDVFIAGTKVGKKGHVIGVDMTPDMISLARKNIAAYTKRSKLNNVEFRLGEIENLPVADSTADIVISNCVINLSPDKPRVWKEIARVLKPDGRVSVSDMALIKPLPKKLAKNIEALIGCVAGAALIEDTRKHIKAAGLKNIEISVNRDAIDAMTDINDPYYSELKKMLPAGKTLGDYVVSALIAARKE